MTTKREGEAVAASEVVLPREPNYVVKALEQATGIPLQPGQDPRTYFDATFDKLDPTTAEAFFALVTDQEALPSNEGLPVRDNGIGDFDDPRPVPPLEAIEERLNNASPDITKEEVARLVAVVMTGFEQPPTQHKLLLAIMTDCCSRAILRSSGTLKKLKVDH